MRTDLEQQAPDLGTIWQDRDQLEGGIGWWQQIREGIDATEFLVLIVTPASIRSSVVQRKWSYARQQGVCVYPVITGAKPDFRSLPHWMVKAAGDALFEFPQSARQHCAKRGQLPAKWLITADEIRPAEWFNDITWLARRWVKAKADDRMAPFVAQKVGPCALVGRHGADNKDTAFIGGAVIDLLLEPRTLITAPRRLEVAR